MHEAVRIVSDVNLVIYTGLAVLMIRSWEERRDRPTLWAAVAFGSLAALLLLDRAVPKHPHGALVVLQDTDIAILVLFPYLLYRFAMAFGQRRTSFEPYIALLTLGLVATTYAIGRFPAPGEARPWPVWAWLIW